MNDAHIPMTVSNHPGELYIEEDEIIDVKLDDEGFLWFEVPMGEIAFGPHDVEQLRRLLNGGDYKPTEDQTNQHWQRPAPHPAPNLGQSVSAFARSSR